ncbi:hypothetical protein GQ42DRAFT_156806 [Ramicandelaber brevisporus]|nr:hypothetical protein GQ42DRAFT_156806 [Ramicandelaber brevisporus]
MALALAFVTFVTLVTLVTLVVITVVSAVAVGVAEVVEYAEYMRGLVAVSLVAEPSLIKLWLAIAVLIASGRVTDVVFGLCHRTASFSSSSSPFLLIVVLVLVLVSELCCIFAAIIAGARHRVLVRFGLDFTLLFVDINHSPVDQNTKRPLLPSMKRLASLNLTASRAKRANYALSDQEEDDGGHKEQGHLPLQLGYSEQYTEESSLATIPPNAQLSFLQTQDILSYPADVPLFTGLSQLHGDALFAPPVLQERAPVRTTSPDLDEFEYQDQCFDAPVEASATTDVRRIVDEVVLVTEGPTPSADMVQNVVQNLTRLFNQMASGSEFLRQLCTSLPSLRTLVELLSTVDSASGRSAFDPLAEPSARIWTRAVSNPSTMSLLLDGERLVTRPGIPVIERVLRSLITLSSKSPLCITAIDETLNRFVICAVTAAKPETILNMLSLHTRKDILRTQLGQMDKLSSGSIRMIDNTIFITRTEMIKFGSELTQLLPAISTTFGQVIVRLGSAPCRSSSQSSTSFALPPPPSDAEAAARLCRILNTCLDHISDLDTEIVPKLVLAAVHGLTLHCHKPNEAAQTQKLTSRSHSTATVNSTDTQEIGSPSLEPSDVVAYQVDSSSSIGINNPFGGSLTSTPATDILPSWDDIRAACEDLVTRLSSGMSDDEIKSCAAELQKINAIKCPTQNNDAADNDAAADDDTPTTLNIALRHSNTSQSIINQLCI